MTAGRLVFITQNYAWRDRLHRRKLAGINLREPAMFTFIGEHFVTLVIVAMMIFAIGLFSVAVADHYSRR
jgi:hypothetical protein